MAILRFSKQGMLANGILVGHGPFPDAPEHIVRIEGAFETLRLGDATVERHPAGVRVQLQDATVEYLHAMPQLLKEHSCNVLVVAGGVPVKRLVKSLEPRLLILHNRTTDEARTLQKELGVQTIAADEHTVVNLAAYNALSSQQRLTR